MSTSSARSARSASSWAQLQQRLTTYPLPEPEDSIALRVLVQLLVTVGILSVSVAAIGVTETSILNLLAIPLSAVGATWSWFRRNRRNILVKFCIAAGMLIVLAVFLVRLGDGLDSRIVLAELLINLQVLHSFDMPRRKDLGYSMVIGLILIGVAATVSQTLVFGLLLVLFLAIALPVLVLDYRSRLGLLVQGWAPLRTGLSPRRLLLVLLLILGLGLVIFAFLPRLPGYQLRTFPVSAPIELNQDFDGENITNPGYVRGGEGNGDAAGGGGGEAEGPGQLDDRFYYGFNQRINQNLRGQMTPEVVMRVRSQAEGFWRVLAFDRYTGQGWEISRNNQTAELRRPRWSYQFFLPPLSPTAQDREIIQTYTITADLPNLIPALYEARQIYFPTSEIAIDPEGGLRSPLNLSEGMTYTVVSKVPIRDRTQLRQARGPYPKAIRDHYLQVPDAIAARVRQRAEEILAQSEQPITEPYEQALYLAQALKQQYQIQPDLPFLERGEDLVEAFLFKHGGGYPDHFSTTLTVMLRSLGIPARLVAGFAPGEFNPFTGFYVVRNTDAYAMTEVYFPQQGWFAFDPIPGHEVIPPSFEEYETLSTIRQFWRWVAGWLPSPVSSWLGSVFRQVSRLFAWIAGWFSRGWVGLLFGLGAITAIAFLGWLAWGGWRTWRYQSWLAQLSPMEGLYQRMLRSLAEEGFHKAPSQTPLEYAQRAHVHVSPERANIVEEISHAYVQWRYGSYRPDMNHLQDRLRSLRQQKRKSPGR